MTLNRTFKQAREDKKDEFYTQIHDIEDELKHYKKHFKDKVVYCNADDPFESNFIRYFALNFNHLGLKKLIATSYTESPISHTQLSLFDINTLEENFENERAPYKIEIKEVKDFNEDGATDWADIEYILKNHKNSLQILKGDGDFRSPESIELLKQADIVVTNPPFSLFREYIAQLIEYNKDFIVIGNNNAITYKEIFPLLQEGKMWLGHNSNKTMEFMLSPSYDKWDRIDEDGNKYGKVPAISWYTSLDIAKRHEELILYRKYNPEDYPTYDNFAAIEVGRVADIPMDYEGVMGVPITFLNKHNPDQFEIVGITDRHNSSGLKTKTYTAKDHENYSDLNRRSVSKNSDGTFKHYYARILIKNKKVVK